jgi:cysteinyl-tRNA synthetase
MSAASSGLRRLRRAVAEAVPDETDVDPSKEPMVAYRARFIEAISEDLGMPSALAVAHGVASADDLNPSQRRALLLDFDRVLGLRLDDPEAPPPAELPEGATRLLDERAAARAARDFATSDRLRDDLAALGVEVRDTPDGQETTIRR